MVVCPSFLNLQSVFVLLLLLFPPTFLIYKAKEWVLYLFRFLKIVKYSLWPKLLKYIYGCWKQTETICIETT